MNFENGMKNKIKYEKKHSAVINMKKLIVSEVHFQRDNEESEAEHEYLFDREIETTECEIKCKVMSVVRSEDDSFALRVDIYGEFEYHPEENNDVENLDIKGIEKNVIAIMFPFLRSQITFITAQPGMRPVILPSININRLFAEQDALSNNN